MHTRTRRCLALWLPYFACETMQMKSGQMATSQTVPAPPDPATPPFALVVRSGNALRLTGVDAMAHRLGLARVWRWPMPAPGAPR